MGEIRCPMCGKLNPDDLDVCQYCEARLKPLIVTPQEEAPEPTSDAEDTLVSRDELPDWLRGVEGDESTSQSEPAPDQQEGDWLSQLQQSGDFVEDESEIDEEDYLAEESEIPDWLQRVKDMREGDDESGEPVSPQPFVEEPSASQIPQKPSLQPDQESAADTTMPDWLKHEFEAEQAEEPTTQPKDDAKVPEWLRSLGDEAAEESLDALPGEEPVFPGDFSLAPQQETPTGEEAADEEIPMPDWLREMDTEPAMDETAFPSDLFEESAGEDKGKADEPVLPMDAGIKGETKDEEVSEAEPATLPDWLSELAGEEVPAPSEEKAEEPSLEEALPRVPAFELGDELVDVENILGEELPEWISEEEAGEEKPPETEEEGLARAKLPSWLESLRPQEEQSLVPEDLRDDDDHVEGTGPLAGIRSVLSAEPEVARVAEPKLPSFKLQVSEAHRANAELLEKFLAEEDKAAPLPAQRLVTLHKIVRLVLALALLILVGMVVFASSSNVSLLDKSLIPGEVLDASRIVDSLPQGAQVLVAIDFEPAFAGELESAAAPFLDHLMLKGARLVFISTSPTGPALAEHLLESKLAQHNYVSGEQYINLGYIAGGEAGLQSFILTPRRLTPFSFDGRDAWSTPPLEGINRIEDFKLIVLVTDRLPTARTWIEQVETVSPEIPFVVVSSAQAAPAIRPYYASTNGQIEGLLGGYTAGVAYEQITGRTISGRAYWDAYTMGLVIAVLAGLFGVGRYIMALVARPKEG